MFCPIGDRNEKRVKPAARPLTTPPLVLFRNWHCECERGSLPLGFQVHRLHGASMIYRHGRNDRRYLDFVYHIYILN